MPVYFTPSKPLEFIEFDYEKFFKSFRIHFNQLTFFHEWKKYWINTFLELDKQIKDYKKKYPKSNPIMQRFNHGYRANEYEIFVYEHITDGVNTIYTLMLKK